MSLLPLLFNELYDTDRYYRPTQLLDQHFGLNLLPDDFLAPTTTRVHIPLRSHLYYRPWRTAASAKDSGSTIVNDKDKFQVNLDVQQFKPEEITVKADGGNVITVEGKHEEKPDEHGFISRHFVRKYVLPKDHDINAVTSSLSSDGVLTITAPKRAIENKGEKVIPITATGPVKSVEDKKEEKK